MIYLATDRKIRVMTPVLDLNKGSMLPRGLESGAPYHLTRTCYKQQEISCGKCGSCQERIEGFKINRVIDPIPYEIDIDWTDCTPISDKY
jgi:7-cyano-7-deazaguanine synthase